MTPKFTVLVNFLYYLFFSHIGKDCVCQCFKHFVSCLFFLSLHIKAIGGGVSHVFYKLILFYRVFLRFKMLFIVLKNSYYFFRYDQSKSGRIIGSLWEGKTKIGKKDYFI